MHLTFSGSQQTFRNVSVTCFRNGVSRCGVYLAVSIAWDKLKSEGDIDVFRAVKTIKMNRPDLVENLVSTHTHTQTRKRTHARKN